MTACAGSGAIQHRTTFTSPHFRKLLGSSWKIYLHILRISIPRAYPRTSWSLNTWFHCGPLTSLFLDSVILRDVYGVARYGHLVGHCFFEESLIHFVDLLIPYLLLKVSFRGSQTKSPFWFSVLCRRNQPGLTLWMPGALTGLGLGLKVVRPSAWTWGLLRGSSGPQVFISDVFISQTITSCFGCQSSSVFFF